MALRLHGLTAEDIHTKVKLLTQNLVNIRDESGKFLLELEDGRVIDTKGWFSWEWTHGCSVHHINIGVGTDKGERHWAVWSLEVPHTDRRRIDDVDNEGVVRGSASEGYNSKH